MVFSSPSGDKKQLSRSWSSWFCFVSGREGGVMGLVVAWLGEGEHSRQSLASCSSQDPRIDGGESSYYVAKQARGGVEREGHSNRSIGEVRAHNRIRRAWSATIFKAPPVFCLSVWRARLVGRRRTNMSSKGLASSSVPSFLCKTPDALSFTALHPLTDFHKNTHRARHF